MRLREDCPPELRCEHACKTYCFMDAVVQQQIKEIEKLRSLQQNIDPTAQQQLASLNQMQSELC